MNDTYYADDGTPDPDGPHPYPPQTCLVCDRDDWIMEVPNSDMIYCANPIHTTFDAWTP